MEQILAIIVFGLLIALCVVGLRSSRRASAGEGGGAFAMTPGRSGGSRAGASPGRRAEDHATVSEVAEPKGLRKDETTSPDRDKAPGKPRAQAERPLGAGDDV